MKVGVYIYTYMDRYRGSNICIRTIIVLIQMLELPYFKSPAIVYPHDCTVLNGEEELFFFITDSTIVGINYSRSFES